MLGCRTLNNVTERPMGRTKLQETKRRAVRCDGAEGWARNRRPRSPFEHPSPRLNRRLQKTRKE